MVKKNREVWREMGLFGPDNDLLTSYNLSKYDRLAASVKVKRTL